MRKISTQDVEPVGNRVLIEVIEDAEVTESGLSLSTENSLQLPTMGKVIRAGSASEYSPGDILLFRRYALDELKFNMQGDEVKIYLADCEDVIGRIINQD